MSLKGGLIGQNTDAGSPILLVGTGDGEGIEIGAEQTSRRRCFLNFSDDRHAVCVFKGRAKIAGGRRRSPSNGIFQLAIRYPRAGGGDFLMFVGNDAIKDVAHPYLPTNPRAGDGSWPIRVEFRNAR